jgi:hypothetical protein
MKTALRRFPAICWWFAVLLSIAVTACGLPQGAESGQARLEPEQVRDRSLGGVPEGFPALSGDGSELAIFHSSNALVDEAVLYVVDLSSRDVVRQFLFVSEFVEGARTIDQDFFARLVEIAADANEYLSAGAFTPIPRLYKMPSLEEMHTDYDGVWTKRTDSRNILFELESGSLTITGLIPSDEGWQMQRPVEVWGPPGGHPFNFCQARGTPYRGWFSEAQGLLILNIGYLAGTHQCDRGDEWVIERLSQP